MMVFLLCIGDDSVFFLWVMFLFLVDDVVVFGFCG